MPTLSKSYTITNEYGFHARPCSAFVQLAAEFTCDVDIEHAGVRVSGKSILGLLTLQAAKDAEVTVYTEGEDAEAALAAIGELIANKFGED